MCRAKFTICSVCQTTAQVQIQHCSAALQNLDFINELPQHVDIFHWTQLEGCQGLTVEPTVTLGDCAHVHDPSEDAMSDTSDETIRAEGDSGMEDMSDIDGNPGWDRDSEMDDDSDLDGIPEMESNFQADSKATNIDHVGIYGSFKPFMSDNRRLFQSPEPYDDPEWSNRPSVANAPPESYRSPHPYAARRMNRIPQPDSWTEPYRYLDGPYDLGSYFGPGWQNGPSYPPEGGYTRYRS